MDITKAQVITKDEVNSYCSRQMIFLKPAIHPAMLEILTILMRSEV